MIRRDRSPGGSSPRARGALAERFVEIEAKGIIPACAGSTTTRVGTWTPARDHPRVRGEHARGLISSQLPRGSSPRARGAPYSYRATGIEAGIIPACAGSTTGRPRPPGCAWDHPRVRGEHVIPHRLAGYPRGSSPRARGALEAIPDEEVSPGIIPACAGST